MPQNALLGWRFGWPRWMDWSKAHKHTAVNKEILELAIGDALASPKNDSRIEALETRIGALERDLRKLCEDAGFA